MIRRRREVASIKAAVLVVREPRPQAGRHVCGLKVARVAASRRRFSLGVESLLRQPLDDPQRVSRSLVEVDDVVFVVARAVAYWSAVLECRVAWRCRCAAADPRGCGARRHMPCTPHSSQHSTSSRAARCAAYFGSFRAY